MQFTDGARITIRAPGRIRAKDAQNKSGFTNVINARAAGTRTCALFKGGFAASIPACLRIWQYRAIMLRPMAKLIVGACS